MNKIHRPTRRRIRVLEKTLPGCLPDAVEHCDGVAHTLAGTRFEAFLGQA